MIRLAERIYAQLLVLYPSSFREGYGRQLRIVFADQLREAEASGSIFAVASVVVNGYVDLVVTAIGQRRAERVRVPRPVAAVVPQEPVRPEPRSLIAMAVAAIPLLSWGLAFMFAPGWLEPLFANPPAVLGLPLGAFLIVIGVTMAALGIAAVGSSVPAFARGALFTFCAFVSMGTLLAGPLIILVLQNLAV